MKIATFVGTRPEINRLSGVIAALDTYRSIKPRCGAFWISTTCTTDF